MALKKAPVQIRQVIASAEKHPLQAARLLYTPPGFVLRGPIYMVAITVFVALVYSFWAKKDDIVTAPLTLERESYTFEAVGGGLVYEVMRQENDIVHTGDPLVRVQEQIRASTLSEHDSMRLQLDTMIKDRDKLADELDHQIQQSQYDLDNFGKSHETVLAQQEASVRQITDQLATAQGALKRQTERLALARTQFDRQQSLYNSRDITIDQYERAHEQLNDAAKGVDDAKSQVDQIRIALGSAQTARDSTKSQTADKLQDVLKQLKGRKERDLGRMDHSIEELKGRIAGGEHLVEGVRYKENMAEYSSPFDGVIVKQNVTRGQIVSAATPLVTIVKNSAALQGRVLVNNKDIGHLRRDEQVRIKYFAYPFQDYGSQGGHICDIANRPTQEGQSLKYVIKISLDRNFVVRQGSSRKTPLQIGLEGTAEIKVGSKRIIELLFSPVSKFFGQDEE